MTFFFGDLVSWLSLAIHVAFYSQEWALAGEDLFLGKTSPNPFAKVEIKGFVPWTCELVGTLSRLFYIPAMMLEEFLTIEVHFQGTLVASGRVRVNSRRQCFGNKFQCHHMGTI